MKGKQYIKPVILVIMLAGLAYKSVYTEKLSERKKRMETAAFDAVAFSEKLWDERMPARMDSAAFLSDLLVAVAKDGEAALKKNANALAIGNYRYALVKLEATVTKLFADELQVQVPAGDSVLRMTLATEFIYGNAIRDASGLVNVKDFPNTADLNGISEALNKIVRTRLLPDFKTRVKEGDRLSLVAAVELNKAHLRWQGLELLPVRLTILP